MPTTLRFLERLLALKSKANVMVLVALGVAFAALGVWAAKIQAERNALATALADSVAVMGTLKVDLAAADLREQGWITFAGAPTPDSAALLQDTTLARVTRERDVQVNTVVRLRAEIRAIGEGQGQEMPPDSAGEPERRQWRGFTPFPGLGRTDWTAHWNGMSLFRLEEELTLDSIPLTFTSGERGGSRFVFVSVPPALRSMVKLSGAEYMLGPVEPPIVVCECDEGHHWIWDVALVGAGFGAGWAANGGIGDVEIRYREPNGLVRAVPLVRIAIGGRP